MPTHTPETFAADLLQADVDVQAESVAAFLDLEGWPTYAAVVRQLVERLIGVRAIAEPLLTMHPPCALIAGPLTKQQAALLMEAREVPALIRPPAPARSLVANNLQYKGLLERVDELDPNDHWLGAYYRPTAAGLAALDRYLASSASPAIAPPLAPPAAEFAVLERLEQYLERTAAACSAEQIDRDDIDERALTFGELRQLAELATGNRPPLELADVLAWIGAAPVAELGQAAEAMKAHVANINRQLDQGAAIQ